MAARERELGKRRPTIILFDPSVGPTRVAEVHRAAPQTCKSFKYSIKASGNVDWRYHECLYTGCCDCLRVLDSLTICHTKLNYGAIYDAYFIGVFSELSKQKARNAATAEKRRAGKHGEAVLVAEGLIGTIVRMNSHHRSYSGSGTIEEAEEYISCSDFNSL
ncbi:hypothetical protein M408DRAFT_305918 [Serendipita vermifera MAFF 305830]|uniref:Uncharacterized protein n=1 Tax=Serendipita vermifera MAFF 305830 TaxID=933852 RepID=A0A0C3ALH5_SERVB|nr:hypothetical protein M408DRAFT_305918 [Serendipita vermifera MAFF 305830]